MLIGIFSTVADTTNLSFEAYSSANKIYRSSTFHFKSYESSMDKWDARTLGIKHDTGAIGTYFLDLSMSSSAQKKDQ